MKIATPDLVTNSYFPALAAEELGLYREEGLDAHVELLPQHIDFDRALETAVFARTWDDATLAWRLKNPANPLSHTTYGKSMAAAMELFERTTHVYGRPEWGIDSTSACSWPC